MEAKESLCTMLLQVGAVEDPAQVFAKKLPYTLSQLEALRQRRRPVLCRMRYLHAILVAAQALETFLPIFICLALAAGGLPLTHQRFLRYGCMMFRVLLDSEHPVLSLFHFIHG
jgi:hypothetical protein